MAIQLHSLNIHELRWSTFELSAFDSISFRQVIAIDLNAVNDFGALSISKKKTKKKNGPDG